jgi:hypothetical protein
MRLIRAALVLVLALGLALATALPTASAAPGRGGALSLIRVPKGPAQTLAVLSRLQIDVRQELATCLLALADRQEQDLLRRRGVRFTVLARDAARREFLVVPIARPGALQSLQAAGRAIPVEAGTAVFWAEPGKPAADFPFDLPRKALARRSVLPYIKTALAAAPPAAQTAAQDPFIEAIVSMVTTADLTATVQTLQDFGTRHSYTAGCEAAGQWLFDSLSSLGLDEVRFETIAVQTWTSRNVIAEKTGARDPDDVYIICGHYDSTSSTPLTLAPGADDNASGTAAVLAAARALAPLDLDFTVRFIAFSGEESGLYGSRAHADSARAAGDRIVGVVNLDMIAFADAMPEDLQIIVNAPSAWLGDLFLAAGSHYGIVGGTRTVDPSFVYSDHAPFWDNGYQALLAIEDDPLNNPYYHRTTDTLDTLNLDFFTSASRAAVGLLAELAQPYKAGHPLTPVGLNAEPVLYSSLFNSLKAVNLTWTGQPDAAGYNIYRTDVPHTRHVRINAAPVTGISFTDETVDEGQVYYYAVTAVGPTGLESNRSQETPASFVAISSLRFAAHPGQLGLTGIR